MFRQTFRNLAARIGGQTTLNHIRSVNVNGEQWAFAVQSTADELQEKVS